MARRRLLIPNAASGLDQLKVRVMRSQGYTVDENKPDNVKYEVASKQGITLKQGNNGNLTTESAGKIGGEIGGSMVKEMVRLAQQQLTNKHNQS